MDCLIGLDDTDSLHSRGTGFQARQLAALLEREGLAQVKGVSRHQLLVSPEIPYTSHNSSACLLAAIAPADQERAYEACCGFLLAESAPGADAGLCLAAWEAAIPAVREFGRRAKREVLSAAEAQALGQGDSIRTAGLTGTGGGVIGALAAVGLRRGGDDGRFLWLRGLRELSGAHSVADLLHHTGIEAVEDPDGRPVPPVDTVEVGEWTRPVLRAGRAVLLVEEAGEDDRSRWRVLAKDTVKRLSE